MIISDLELFLIELPASGGAVRSLIVRIATESGAEGWGETRTRWRAAELAARRKVLLTVLAGREAFDVESILALDALAEPAVACGVEMALWDLVARARGSRCATCSAAAIAPTCRWPCGCPPARRKRWPTGRGPSAPRPSPRRSSI